TRIFENWTEPDEPFSVALEEVQHVGLHNIIEVVGCGNLVRPNLLCGEVDGLSPKNTAIGASGHPLLLAFQKVVQSVPIEIFERNHFMLDPEILTILCSKANRFFS